jgi:hypothetical protein
LDNSNDDKGVAFLYYDKHDKPCTLLLLIDQSYVRQLSNTASNPASMRSKLRDTCVSARLDASNISRDV